MYDCSNDETEFVLDSTGDEKTERLHNISNLRNFFDNLLHGGFYLTLGDVIIIMIFLCMFFLFFAVMR